MSSTPLSTDLPPRPEHRQFAALLVIGLATALALGVTLYTSTFLEANDISRWCTVESLLERGTYAIDGCPWRNRTQDKVQKLDKLQAPDEKSSALVRFEYQIAPRSWKVGKATERFYSSKPPLLPTMIAGLLYPFRAATGVPLDRVVEEQRHGRWVEKPIEGQPGKNEFVLEVPKETLKWPVYVFYFKPIIILLNVVPFLIGLILYARLLDRHAKNEWSWLFSLFAAGMGTLLFAFLQTLNNHTVAAASAFFALYAFIRIWDEGANSWGLFIAAGFFGAFCTTNELPAAPFGLILFGTLLVRDPRKTLLGFVPAAIIPIAAFLSTQYLAFGHIMPVYEEFGTKSYTYEGSYWNAPLEMDYFNKEPESHPVYLFHMTFGHHGIFALTPVFLFSLWGATRLLIQRRPLRAVAGMTWFLTVAMLAFYLWNPKARNYGGSTQGLRWLFWLIPFWLIVLPAGTEDGQKNKYLRWLALLALAISVMSIGYALHIPWSHPWVVDFLEHFSLYRLYR